MFQITVIKNTLHKKKKEKCKLEKLQGISLKNIIDFLFYQTTPAQRQA